MVLGEQRMKIKSLLRDTITLLCKNGLNFDSEFSVEALIGITLDKTDVFLVSINESVQSEFALQKAAAQQCDLAGDESPDMVGSGDDQGNLSEHRRRRRRRKRRRSSSENTAQSKEWKSYSNSNEEIQPVDVDNSNEEIQPVDVDNSNVSIKKQNDDADRYLSVDYCLNNRTDSSLLPPSSSSRPPSVSHDISSRKSSVEDNHKVGLFEQQEDTCDDTDVVIIKEETNSWSSYHAGNEEGMQGQERMTIRSPFYQNSSSGVSASSVTGIKSTPKTQSCIYTSSPRQVWPSSATAMSETNVAHYDLCMQQRIFPDQDMYSARTPNKPSPFQCSTCNKTFTMKCNLKTHVRSMHNNAQYTCACGKVFKWQAMYSKHKNKCDVFILNQNSNGFNFGT